MALEFPQNLSTKFNVELKVESQNSKKDFENLQEYTKYLSDKYGVNAGQRMISGVPTTINVSSAFIKEAFENPDKRKFLEENLEAMQSLEVALRTQAIISPSSEMTHAGFIVDESGNISMFSGGKTKDSWVSKNKTNSWQNTSSSADELEKILEKARKRQKEFEENLEKSLKKAEEKAKQLQEELQSHATQNQIKNAQTTLSKDLSFEFEVSGKDMSELLENFKITLNNITSSNALLDLKA